MPDFRLFGTIGRRLAEIFQRNDITLTQFLQEWQEQAIAAKDTETLKRINWIMKNRLEMVELENRWLSKDQQYILDTVYPEQKQLKHGNGNGGR